MNIQKFFAASAVSVMMLAATALPSFASTAHLSGTWQIVDRGPGAWAGGTLREDGTANGSGGFAFRTPDGVTQVAHIEAVSWQQVSSDQIVLCANITGQQGYVFPVGTTITQCLPLYITGSGAPIPTPFDPGAYEKVMLH